MNAADIDHKEQFEEVRRGPENPIEHMYIYDTIVERVQQQLYLQTFHSNKFFKDLWLDERMAVAALHYKAAKLYQQ